MIKREEREEEEGGEVGDETRALAGQTRSCVRLADETRLLAGQTGSCVRLADETRALAGQTGSCVRLADGTRGIEASPGVPSPPLSHSPPLPRSRRRRCGRCGQPASAARRLSKGLCTIREAVVQGVVGRRWAGSGPAHRKEQATRACGPDQAGCPRLPAATAASTAHSRTAAPRTSDREGGLPTARTPEPCRSTPGPRGRARGRGGRARGRGRSGRRWRRGRRGRRGPRRPRWWRRGDR